MNEKEITLTKQRDFSETISDAFSFIRNEFKPLLRTVLIYVGPVILITGFFSAWYQSYAMNLGMSGLQGTDLKSILEFYGKLFNFKYTLVLLGSMISSILLSLAVLSYIKLYKSAGRGNFDSSEVWYIMKQKIAPVLGGYLLIGLAFIVVAAVVGVTFYISPFLTGILALVYLIVVIYFSIALSLFVSVVVLEDLSVIESIKRSIFLVKNYWWLTFGILFISSLLTSIGQAIFNIPTMIIGIISGFTAASGGTPDYTMSMLSHIFTVIGTFGSYLLYIIPFTAIAIHYYSQVEKKESPGLSKDIEQIK